MTDSDRTGRTRWNPRSNEGPAEAVLDEGQRTLSTILESIGDGFILLDPEWRFLYANRLACSSLGIELEDLVGRSLWEAVPRIRGTYIEDNYRQAMERQEPVQFEIEGLYTERSFEVVAWPSRDGLSIIGRDITDQKRSRDVSKKHDALEEQTHILQSILDSMGDGVLVLDERGEVLVWNPAARAILGELPASVQSGLLGDARDTPASDEVRQGYSLWELPIRRAMGGEATDDAEVVVRKSAGEKRWLSITARPLRDGSGRIRGGVSLLRDVTDAKLAERKVLGYQQQLRSLAAELTSSEQRERRRLSVLLHDHLQQLLAAAKLSLQPVEVELPEGHARLALRRVDELIEKSLEASRNLSIELCPPVLYEAGLVPALHWLARSSEKRYGLEVEVEAVPDAEPAAEDVRSLLFEAVRELLFNVRKHAGTNRAQIRMSCPERDWMEITVSDAGTGFDPAVLEAHDAGRGGLGLFSIRERLELAGGAMDLRSNRGGGTEITLRAPRRTARPAQNVRRSSGARSQRLSENAPPEREAGRDRWIRVVLADDHEILREGLANLLRQHSDIEIVGEAADGEAAVELALRLRPDVIVMDVSMSPMNGIEATERITRELEGVRVIGLSMHTDQNVSTAMHNAGASAFLTKGGPARDLIDAIRGVSSADPP